MIITGDYILFASETWLAAFYLLVGVLVAVGATVTAASPQPTPDRRRWARTEAELAVGRAKR